MKNLSYVFYPAIVVFIFGSMFFGDDYSSWQRERRNKKIAEEELERLVDNYGLNIKIQNPIEARNNCSFYYALYESKLKLGYIEGKLKDRDSFMVNCIPIILELSNKCEAERKAIDEKYPYEIREDAMGGDCEIDVLNSLVFDK